MGTLFSKIILGEIPCHKIAEDDNFLAFLDINPLKEGHTLVIPKIEIDYLFDMEDDALGELMKFSKRVAKAIKITIPCTKVGVSVVGLEVPHAHIHLIPINSVAEMNFSAEKMSVSENRLAEIANQIRLSFS